MQWPGTILCAIMKFGVQQQIIFDQTCPCYVLKLYFGKFYIVKVILSVLKSHTNIMQRKRNRILFLAEMIKENKRRRKTLQKLLNAAFARRRKIIEVGLFMLFLTFNIERNKTVIRLCRWFVRNGGWWETV